MVWLLSACEPTDAETLLTPALILAEQDGDGEAVTGAEVTFDPQMPATGHGAADTPVTAVMEPGVYEGSWTWSMPGAWEVTVLVAAEGADDTFVLPVQVASEG